MENLKSITTFQSLDIINLIKLLETLERGTPFYISLKKSLRNLTPNYKIYSDLTEELAEKVLVFAKAFEKDLEFKIFFPSIEKDFITFDGFCFYDKEGNKTELKESPKIRTWKLQPSTQK